MMFFSPFISVKRGQRGWWIGGKLVQGEWQWADGTQMQYQNFPPLEGETGLTSSAANVVNYVGIFYDYGCITGVICPLRLLCRFFYGDDGTLG
jgi:hypothetical protein